MKLIFGLLTVTILGSSLMPLVFGQVENRLGTVGDLILDDTKRYYFETQKDSRSTTWIDDTQIKVADGKTIQGLSEKLFIYPTELVQDKENLYFAVLSEECKGQVFCDYQDLYKMSKNDGSFLVLTEHLKSSIHLSVENDFVYVSESNGNIWKISKNSGSKELIIRANEIIMDLATHGDRIYWIEELSDQNSNVLTLENSQPKIIAKNLKIPYDLTIQNDTLYWNEILVKPHQAGFSEFTAIKSYNGKTTTLIEFQNTSPVSIALNEPHYGPYFVFDDYLFLVNNTNDDSTIHMINLHNSTKYDIGVISDYDAKYLRADETALFVIGKNENGFVIDRHSLPITVPEFPSIMLFILPVAITSAFILLRFSHNLSR